MSPLLFYFSPSSCKLLYLMLKLCEMWNKNSFFLFILLPTETNSRPLSLPFPTSHPYQTHISKYAMFPDFRSPEDRDTGTDASSCQSFHSNISCKAFDMVVLRNTRGKMVLCSLITYSRILFRTLLKSHDSFLMKLKRARIWEHRWSSWASCVLMQSPWRISQLWEWWINLCFM